MATTYETRTSAPPLVRTPGHWILLGIFTFVGLANLLTAGISVLASGAMENVEFLRDTNVAGWNLGIADQYSWAPLVVGGVMLVLGLLNFVAAYGVFNMHRWGWGLGVLLAVIGLVFFPIGTVFAIVTLVYLFTSPVRHVTRARTYADDDARRPVV